MTLIKSKATGVYKVGIHTPSGRKKYISTKATSLDEAKRIVKDSGLADLQSAAKAGRLTQQAISHITAGRKLTILKAIDAFRNWGATAFSTIYLTNLVDTLLLWSERAQVGHLPLAAIADHHIDPWINDVTSGAKASTRKVQLAALRTFFKFCSVKGWCAGNPAALVRVRFDLLSHEQKESRDIQTFTEAEVRKLLAYFQKMESPFWTFAVALSYEIGLRLGDVCQLEWASFEPSGTITVWTAKRAKRIQVPLSRPVSELLTRIPVTSMQYVFPEERLIYLDPARRSRFSVYFARFCAELDIQGKSFHSLRHTRVTKWRREGLTLEDIAQKVGHSNTKTTAGYDHSTRS